MAVPSWRFLTSEIAVKRRLKLYYQLEKICGKKLVVAYNLANGVLFCLLAEVMITVLATAVGIAFDMEAQINKYYAKWRYMDYHCIDYWYGDFVDCFQSGQLDVIHYCVRIFGLWNRSITTTGSRQFF